ncbi:hypothetical protein LCGC14_0580730 [marine sediment metagenome]|uniref:Uncharacterized protein n=1 Tax=marine sediment metagenome TaxID=412755 RepID=A0A0F9U2N8_9ZZZZ
MAKRTSILDKIYRYGGELWRLGDIIIDLQNIMPNQKCVDRYLQGLFFTQDRITINTERNLKNENERTIRARIGRIPNNN